MYTFARVGYDEDYAFELNNRIEPNIKTRLMMHSP